MRIKFIEIRDSMTFVPAVSFRVINDDDTMKLSRQESYLLERAGFPFCEESTKYEGRIVLWPMSRDRVEVDSAKWKDRTFATIHRHLEEHWDDVVSGQVLDVEFILGETTKPKESEGYE